MEYHKQPSSLAFFWWRNFFSDSPTSVFKESDVYYDRNGRLHYPQDRRAKYIDYYPGYCDCSPSYSYSHHHHGNQCSGCGDGDGWAIAFLVLFSFIALIIASALVFTYPPIMIISWTILVIGSFFQIDGTEPSCFDFRIFNIVSSIVCLFYLFWTIFSIIRLQKHYKGYYPGTPGVEINHTVLLSYFKFTANVYFFSFIPSGSMLIAGIIVSVISYNQSLIKCAWTFSTVICWIIVHFLNIVASYAMYKRFICKYSILFNPPVYDQYSVQASNIGGYPQTSPPTVSREEFQGLPSYEK